ncbi:MAG TPA: hypothetical protein PLZ36_01150 [Armatimonadota bacterium]|nr:hypothetical protein [Armatimonadota bacterium]HOS43406.1 hypothetical protein [Armatimonadota bacterium]
MTRVSLAVWLLASLCLSLASPAAPTKWMVTGYVQGRVTDTLDETPQTASTFQIRRAYMYVRGAVDEHITGTLLLAMQPTVRAEHAYAEYAAKPYMVRLGLVPLPLGYEIPLTSSRLVTLERSQIVTDLVVKNGGQDIYFFDRGIFLYYLPAKGLNVSAALINGQPVENSSGAEGLFTNDRNDGKPIVARVGYSIPGGEVGVSYYGGNRRVRTAASDGSQRLTLYAFDLATNRGPFTIIAEAMAGTDGGIEKEGGYLTVAYRKEGSASQPYLRFDIEDQDTAAPNTNYKRLTAGYAYYLNPAAKVSLEYESIDAGAAFAPAQPNSRLTGQYQIIF